MFEYHTETNDSIYVTNVQNVILYHGVNDAWLTLIINSWENNLKNKISANHMVLSYAVCGKGRASAVEWFSFSNINVATPLVEGNNLKNLAENTQSTALD